jgi:RNA polymerase sigma factor (sigma-70 family)
MQQLEKCTDEELMQEYQQCNEKAFEVLYQRHSGKVYGFLKKKLKDEAFVDDVFQATFLKLHHARSHYDPNFPFLPWLFTVCRSVLVDSIRKRERISEDLNEVAIENAVANEEVAPEPLPDLGALPASQRQAIALRYEQDLSFEEIAKRLETSPANVRQMISRGIRRLKNLMDGSGVRK